MATNAAIGAFVTLLGTGSTPANLTASATDTSSTLDLQHASASVGVNPGTLRTSGVTLFLDYTHSGSSTPAISVEISNDSGTTWFACPEYNLTLDASGDDFVIEVAPLGVQDTHLRVKSTQSTTTASTLLIRARLDGIHKVVT